MNMQKNKVTNHNYAMLVDIIYVVVIRTFVKGVKCLILHPDSTASKVLQSLARAC